MKGLRERKEAIGEIGSEAIDQRQSEATGEIGSEAFGKIGNGMRQLIR